MQTDLQKLTDKITEICKQRNWSRTWTEGGVYLHLEASEFIEALRGKGESTSTDEAADVLFVLLSLVGANNIDIAKVIESLEDKLTVLKTKKKYKGEHTSFIGLDHP